MYRGLGACRRSPAALGVHATRSNPYWYLSRNSLPIRTISTSSSRPKPAETGDHKTGHIDTTAEEGIFFFNNIFPLRLQWIFRVPFRVLETRVDAIVENLDSKRFATTNPAKILLKTHENDQTQHVEVHEIIPRLKEGGVFVKFSKSPDVPLESVEERLRAYLKDNPIRPMFNPFDRVRAGLVRGRPWIEDLFRPPCSRVKVEFLAPEAGKEAAELSQEQLYALFRRYGKLMDIVSQPADSKIVPRYATLSFAQTTRAILARNCMHGLRTTAEQGGGALLRLSYEKSERTGWIKDWLFSHPRIVLPFLAVILGTITVTIFDPIREFFIEMHVKRQFSFTGNVVWKWLRSQTTSLFRRHNPEDPGMGAIWDDRRPNIEQLQTWLLESTDTFVVVQGPRGSGKRELVAEQALKGRKNKLVIDCKPVQEARGDTATINAIASEVGYKPVFSMLNSMSGMLDLAAQSLTGVKAGFSETLDGQVNKILNATATALKTIALEDKKKVDKDGKMSDDEYLEAHPDKRAVVVIDKFLHKSQDGSIVYDKLAEWAAQLVTSNIAHVIFLTHDVSFTKSLSKALPDRVFREMSLGDCSPEVAKRFVIQHLDANEESKEEDKESEGNDKKLTPSLRRRDLDQLDDSIALLGGRLTDLEFFARRLKAGETPGRAVAQIIEQSSSEILKMYIFGSEIEGNRKWTSEQAWTLIKMFSQNDSLRYNEVLLDDAFKKNGDDVLQAMEQAELVSVVSERGRPCALRPGKPVFLSAFRLLTGDRVLQSRLDLAILSAAIKSASSDIDSYESELRLLGELPNQPRELWPRIHWLLSNLAASQQKIQSMEKQQASLKRVLQSEY